MPLPTQRPTFLKYYVLYVPSVLAASSPAIPIMGRGRVVDIRYVPIAAVATASQTVTPKVNATQMQLNGSNVTGTLTSGASVNAVDAASDAPVAACPNGPPAGGICCGNVPCYQCQNQNDCARCTTASCVAPEVCCRRNGNKVECTAADSCN